MRKYVLLLAFVVILIPESCNKTKTFSEEKNNTDLLLSENYSELQESLLALNQKMSQSSPETRSFFRWLLVGISDAVGAACGYSVGGIGGAIVLGSTASAVAITEFTPWENNQGLINGPTALEEQFDIIIPPGSSHGCHVGGYHNNLLRLVFQDYGDSFLTMNEESIWDAISNEYPLLGLEDTLSLSWNNVQIEDFVFDPEMDVTPEDFILSLCADYPSISQELCVLETILDGLDAIQSDTDALTYTAQAIQIIENAQIAEDSKSMLICGTSVAFRSRLLWNLP
jgi:hypothetical protein